MWDAKNAVHDGTGTPGKGAWKLGKATRAGKRSQTGLQVGVSSAWLSDTSRVFPVTIDPTYVKFFDLAGVRHVRHAGLHR